MRSSSHAAEMPPSSHATTMHTHTSSKPATMATTAAAAAMAAATAATAASERR
jgi:hypothetical protein